MNMRILFSLPACLALLLTGCGGGDGKVKVPVTPVTGTITLDGEPLADASVSFAPDSGQPLARGKTNAEGVYNLTTYDLNDGAADGSYTVLITKVEKASAEANVLDPNDPNYGKASAYPGKSKEKMAVPANYSDSNLSPLKVTIPVSSPDMLNFTLNSK